MIALCVIFFFAGCISGGMVASWYHRRPSKFDQWRKKIYQEHKDDPQPW